MSISIIFIHVNNSSIILICNEKTGTGILKFTLRLLVNWKIKFQSIHPKTGT